jgi:hypothetical protein
MGDVLKKIQNSLGDFFGALTGTTPHSAAYNYQTSHGLYNKPFTPPPKTDNYTQPPKVDVIQQQLDKTQKMLEPYYNQARTNAQMVTHTGPYAILGPLDQNGNKIVQNNSQPASFGPAQRTDNPQTAYAGNLNSAPKAPQATQYDPSRTMALFHVLQGLIENQKQQQAPQTPHYDSSAYSGMAGQIGAQRNQNEQSLYNNLSNYTKPDSLIG